MAFTLVGMKDWRRSEIGFFHPRLRMLTSPSSMHNGVGASTGFGTSGGGKAKYESMKRKQLNVSTDLLQIRQKLAEKSDKITVDTNNAITKLFSPISQHYTTFRESSCISIWQQSSSRYISASKKEKLITERRIIYMKEQMNFYKYMLSSEHHSMVEK